MLRASEQNAYLGAPIAVVGPFRKLSQILELAFDTLVTTKSSAKLHTHFLAGIPNPSLRTES